jgi:F-type H+-transporting ATPase subunit b
MTLLAAITDISTALSVWTLVTFVLLLIVLGKFAWRPILATIAQREKTIADAIESAKRERLEAEKASQEMRATLEKVRNEAADLARKTQAEVAAAKEQLMAEARKQSDELLASARKTIAEERRQAVAELRSQTVDLAIAAANRLLSGAMDEKKQRALVEEYLSKLPKEARL